MGSPRRWCTAAWAALVAVVCAGPETDRNAPPPEAVAAAEEISFETVADMAAELEVLDHEIAGLADYLAARPDWTPPDPTDPDPRAVLEAARDTRAAAASALAAADTARAADSLRAAAARIEHVKRLLFVAEEMGIEVDPAEGTVAPD
jgi:hypothetical protein